MDNQQTTPQPTQPVEPVSVQQPVQSASAGTKESGPVLTIEPTQPEKVIAETAPEAHIPQEVAEAGVTAEKAESIAVPQDLQAQGVQPVGVAVPIPEEPNITLPMTEEKARGILKMHKKVKESVTWLAMLVLRQMQVFRFNEEKKTKEKRT